MGFFIKGLHCISFTDNIQTFGALTDPVYITLLLFCWQSESSFRNSASDVSLYNTPDEKLLYVYESVELELLLTTPRVSESTDEEDVFTCPIRLIKGLFSGLTMYYVQ